MKNVLLTAAILSPVLGLAACTTVPENAKPYTCAEYNAARAKIAANPSQAYTSPELLKFNKVNLVGFRSAVSKHPSKADALRYIDDAVDVQAKQCRLVPDAVIHYTAEQVTPASVRLGYMVDFKGNPVPAEVKTAQSNLRLGKPVENEAGMKLVKDFVQNCAAQAAPAHACKLGGL